MDWTAPVDIYCERVGPHFWAEPVNAFSNAAFIVAGIAGWIISARQGERKPLTAILCVLAIAIGIGSFLFHTFAERWAGLADVIPILLFIVIYLLAATHGFFGLKWVWAVPAAAAAFGLALTMRSAVLWLNGGESLNGSEGYAPAIALLIGAALLLALRGHPAARPIGLGAAVFFASLVARTADASVCAHFPLGTHFLWHVLNGTMIFLLLLAWIRHARLVLPQG